MAHDPDDDALRWDGDDDPTLAPGWKRVGGVAEAPASSGGEPATADGEVATTEDPAASDDVSDAASGAAEGRRQTGSVELVVLGVLGGVYLLYTIGWLITVLRTDAPGTSIVGDAMYLFGLWLAVLAPALWFGLVSVVTKRPVTRLAWLAVGAVVLVPLPFVLGVTA
ncbi:DNA polymerase III subunit gamma/tau [Agromyces sp. LHK192]|uniref:DNA polymerase III subunit gamma/tau n=1 Tax=Agromyces sp. LHK192 TaxID=2498704 RepID=UPI000FD8233A|nr:DNA polymerase III subunit gamma/tau [Agromyces sp. LHK192]